MTGDERMEGWDSTSPADLDRELRPSLHNVRLVGELDLAPDSELYLRARSASGRFITRQKFYSLSGTCPAALSIFLVAEGIHRYEGGEYWPNVSVRGIENPNDQRAIGRQFLRSLTVLGLETFEDVQEQEGGHKYVLPILLHGGVPRYCASDLWRKLIEELRDGAGEADQVVAYWLSRQTLLQGLDRPVRRFLRFGGDFAVDLIQRMIDLVDILSDPGAVPAIGRDAGSLAEEVGLPTYLVETLLELGSRAIVRRSGPRFPRPRVVIDPFSGAGPSVVLPRKADGTNADRWIVRGRSSRVFAASRAEDREVLLDRAPRWLVSLEAPQVSRSFPFGGLARAPLHFFDADTGELLKDQDRPRSDGVVALSPADVRYVTDLSTGSTVPEQEELPPLSGTWSGYMLRKLDLRSLTRFTVEFFDAESGAPRQEDIFVNSRGSRPRLATTAVGGVRDVQGHEVFATVPSLAVDPGQSSLDSWRVRFRGPGVDRDGTLADLSREGEAFDLGGLVPGDRLLTGDLQILGPLGSDLRASFVVVPGLSFEPPHSVISPDDPVTVELMADGADLNGAHGRVALEFGPGEHTKDVEVVDAGTGIATRLLVSVPRLLWLVRRGTEIRSTFGHEPAVVRLDELEAGDVDALLVRLGRPSEVQLRLIGDGAVLQSTKVGRAAGSDGRWTFPLQPFVTTAVHSGLAKLELRVVAGATEATAVVVRAVYEATGISLESIIDEAEGFTCCEVSWSERRPFRGREIRLWSRHRPWDGPVTVAVDDDAPGTAFFSLDAKLTAGPYLVEIGLRDAWLSPRRPRTGACNVASVQVGSHADLSTHLRSLDPSSAVDALELLVEAASGGRDHGRNAPSGVMEQVCVALPALLVELGRGAIEDRVCVLLCELAASQPGPFATWLADKAASTVEPLELTQLVVVLLPDLLAAAPHTLSERARDRLWEVSVLAGAALDPPVPGDIVAAGRWEYFTGWDPSACAGLYDEQGQLDRLPERCGPIDTTFAGLSPERLAPIAAALRPEKLKPLRWNGYLEAVFAFLETTWPDHEVALHWRFANSRLNDMRVRQDDLQTQYLDALGPPAGTPIWCLLPQELLAAAFHLVACASERVPATAALWDATDFAHALVERSILLAIALRHLAGHADG